MHKTHRLPNHQTDLQHSHAKRWLLAHDIRDSKRLARVWRYLRKEANRLQYSVYIIVGDRARLEQVMQEVLSLIDEKQDDVRIYPITESTRIWGLGNQFIDDGNTLCDEVLDRLIHIDYDQQQLSGANRARRRMGLGA